MITTLTNTTASAVDRTMNEMRETFGANALSRVLTLIIVTSGSDFDDALEAAVQASHEHPSRVLVVHQDPRRLGQSLDAEIRVGRDAGAGDIVILHVGPAAATTLDTLVMPLLLPDAPIVTWWPKDAPSSPANDVLGAMSQRRITDARSSEDPLGTLHRLRTGYTRGDTDLSWARITKWRGLLATAYETPPVSVPTRVTLSGDVEDPALTLLAAWLERTLGVSVERTHAETDGYSVQELRLTREDGDIVLTRDGAAIRLTLPGERSEHGQHVALPHRSLYELLAEELRRLDPDEVYGEVLAHAFDRVTNPAELTIGSPRPVVHVSDSPEESAKEAAADIAAHIAEAIAQRGEAHLVLTGGGAGIRTAEALIDAFAEASVNTSALHLWWGDERFVTADSEDRNDRQLQEVFLDRLSIPDSHVHRMPPAGAGMTLDQAATWYGQQLDSAGGDVPFHTDGAAFFDVLMLGMGPDMHIASLFPEHPDQRTMSATAIPVRNSPKPPAERISLSWPAINSARHVAIMATGQEKADAARTALSVCDAWTSPASSVRGTESTVFHLDAEAASTLTRTQREKGSTARTPRRGSQASETDSAASATAGAEEKENAETAE